MSIIDIVPFYQGFYAMIYPEPNGIVPHRTLSYLLFPLGVSVTFATIYIVEDKWKCRHGHQEPEDICESQPTH
jgi:hypothetical protein